MALKIGDTMYMVKSVVNFKIIPFKLSVNENANVFILIITSLTSNLMNTIYFFMRLRKNKLFILFGKCNFNITSRGMLLIN